MPSSLASNLSSESLSALLFALGLTETSSDETGNTKPTLDPIPGISRYVAHNTMHFQRPTAPFSTFSEANDQSYDDEAQVIGRDFFSDFDVGSDLEDDKDSDLDFETLPSRPGSSLDGFHCIESPASTIQQHHIITSPPSTPNSYQSSNHLDSLYVKAAHNASIIMLRTPRDITFTDLKKRLYDKFVNQEDIHLSPSFSVLLALPPSSSPPTPRPSPVSIAFCTEMSFIDREIEWRRIVARNDGSKITLRILDTPP